MSVRSKITRIFKGKDEMDKYLCDLWVNLAEEAIADHGAFIIAISGGSTPMSFYKELAGLDPALLMKTHFFMVDERFVPEGDPDHNFSNISKVLFEKLAIPENHVHPIITEGDSAEECAEMYDSYLTGFFEWHEATHFDLVLLGIGNDGHTASLFPGTEALNINNKKAYYSTPLDAPHDRITITYPMINNAAYVVFMICGESKSEVAHKIIQENDMKYPASYVLPMDGEVYYLLDEEAGGDMKEG